MPAIWHRKFTVRTRKFDGGCAAATTTCRAGAASVARKSSVTVCPGNRYSTPPSTAMLFLQSSSVLSRQRMASRSSRSPVLTPARQAGEAASLKKGPVTSAILPSPSAKRPIEWSGRATLTTSGTIIARPHSVSRTSRNRPAVICETSEGARQMWRIAKSPLPAPRNHSVIAESGKGKDGGGGDGGAKEGQGGRKSRGRAGRSGGNEIAARSLFRPRERGVERHDRASRR